MTAAWTVPRLWPGETAFVLGGGPSLADFDVGRLRGRRVIATNDAYRLAPWAEFLIAMDDRWWGWHRAAVGREFAGGHIVTIWPWGGDGRLRVLQRTGLVGLETEPNGICFRRTVLHAAINIGVHLGAARVVLLGADMETAADGRTHWHQGHPKGAPEDRYGKMMRDLETTVKPLAAAGVAVLNGTPGGRLEVFPRIHVEELP